MRRLRPPHRQRPRSAPSRWSLWRSAAGHGARTTGATSWASWSGTPSRISGTSRSPPDTGAHAGGPGEGRGARRRDGCAQGPFLPVERVPLCRADAQGADRPHAQPAWVTGQDEQPEPTGWLVTRSALSCEPSGKGSAERVTEIAVELLLLTMLRTIELRGGWWHEIDWQAELWRIGAERMKKKRPHIVPLSPQAMALLRELRTSPATPPGCSRTCATGAPDGARNHPSCLRARRLWRRFTPHGCRGTAATLMRESGFDREHVELQLAHQRGKPPYDHAAFIEPRREMLTWWADLIDAEFSRL